LLPNTDPSCGLPANNRKSALAMTAQDLVPWFQMASTVLTGIGIIVSVSLGIASLNNNKRERLFKIRPDLLFNIGGQVVKGAIAPFETFVGKSPDDPEVQEFLKKLPDDAICLLLHQSYGQLFNLGQGTAFNANIWFEPQRLTANGQERWLKRSEQVIAPNTKDWNTIPATPANLPAGASGSFGILPGAVHSVAPDVTVVSGRMRIECRDSHGNPFQWTQDAAFFIDRIIGDEATITVSFEPRST
jgi:hypothetical protein